jgi:hypothetical protein
VSLPENAVRHNVECLDVTKTEQRPRCPLTIQYFALHPARSSEDPTVSDRLESNNPTLFGSIDRLSKKSVYETLVKDRTGRCYFSFSWVTQITGTPSWDPR